ncbi:MAG: zinc ribbon domain-containing protein [Atopobiaceae bacterium]|nr:zinc ribbon domain-containing protein [Atopobiaceae bacterium]
MRLSHKRLKNDAADFALSGRLWCSQCGKPMHGETYGHDRWMYSRYVCRHRRRPCVGSSNQQLLEGSIADALRKLISDREFCKHLADEHVRWQEGQDQGRASIKAAQKELRGIVRQRDNLIHAVEDGMPWELARDRIAVLEDTKTGVERRIEELKTRRVEISREDIMSFFSAAANGYLSDEELIDLFVAKAFLYEGKVALVLNVATSDVTQDEFETAIAQQQMTLNAQVNPQFRETRLWCPRADSNGRHPL